MTTYLSATDTAKLVRQALKESFPGVRFSVRSESYNHVRVSWTDGPTTRAVDEVVNRFDGTYFDGMIDYAGSNFHLLDGKRVHFSGTSTSRSYSDAAENAIKGAWAQLSQHERIEILRKVTGLSDGRLVGWANDEDPYDSGWRQMLYSWDFYGRTRDASPTLTRVSFLGDDGYGAGTVGTPENPGSSRGYPQA